MSGGGDAPVSLGHALTAGIRCRCPRCGKGKLFQNFLTVRPACSACGLDFSAWDSGDGPAVFVILILGFLVIGGALAVEVAFAPPMWVHLLLWIPLSVLGVALMLPWFKATLIALQYKHKASEGQLDD